MRQGLLVVKTVVLGTAIAVAAALGSSARAQAGRASPTPAPGSAAVDCGMIQTLGTDPTTDPSAGAVESCFFNAFQNCQPAMLTLITRGVDTSLTQSFTASGNAGACQVAGASSSVVIPRGSRTSSFTCDGVVQQGSGLVIQDCGSFGDIAVPGPTGS